MKIKRLELSGYTRLLLSNINHIVLTPESIYQLILGTNGSGKSSILDELTPLPGQSAHYSKGGFKKISVTDRGFEYELTSSFKSGNKHKFVKDGEELNPGGTGAVQKELVQQEFGITQDIHNLLIGKTNFTNLSPAKRREWIVSLSHVDFTYALGVHQKLKSGTRDTQGALKHAKGRITGERNKLLAIGDLEALEERFQTLHQELEVLFNERSPSTQDVKEGEQEVNRILTNMEELSDLLIRKAPPMPKGTNYTCLGDVDEDLQTLKTEIEVQSSLQNRIGTEQDELQTLLDGFKEAGVESVDKLREQIRDIKQERTLTHRKLKTWMELHTDAAGTQRSYYGAATPLINLLSMFPKNPDNMYNSSAVKQTQKDLPDIRHRLEKYRNRLAHYETQLEHLNGLKKEECPKCNYRWVPGRSDREKAALESTIVKGREAIASLETQVHQRQTFLDEADVHHQHMYGLKQLVHEYPQLQDLWEGILQDTRLQEEPNALIDLVHRFGQDLEHHVTIQNASERLEKLEKLMESPTEGHQLNGVVERLEGLHKQVEELTRTLENQKRRHDHISKFRQHVKVYLEKVEELDENLKSLESLRDALVSGYRNHHINNTIRQHQEQLGGLQARRTEKQTLEGIIKDLEQDEQQLGQDHEALKLLADELSPVDGLIAEQLTGFIESLTQHINQVIDQVWTYELKVLPCGLESGDLDYKFPLYSNNGGESKPSKDISEGSEAQVEMVNLAFRLVIMTYLGLDEYPVYLDEVGACFDEQHRTNLLSFIKQLVDAGNYTQLFIISHYAAQFNVFISAETLVLDGTNVSVPKEHNQHAEIS